MNESYNTVALFTPPRLAEERKAYWPGMQQYGQADVATGSFGGLRGFRPFNGLSEGFDFARDILGPVHANVMDTVDSITGAKGQREAQANAIKLAQLQAQAEAAAAQQRAMGWGKVAPWLAVGGALVAVAVIVAARR